MITVVETEDFLADVEGVLSEDEHDALILYVAQHPEEGALIPDTGGLRKALDGEGKGQERWIAGGLLFSQRGRSSVPDGDLREEHSDRCVGATAEGPGHGTPGTQAGLEEQEIKMKRECVKKKSKESALGEKLLRSARQARDWVNGKPVRARVTHVPVPQIDVQKLRAGMGLSQTQFAARFGFSLDSIQNWEQGHRQPEGPARVLLAVIAKNPKAVEEALGSS